MEPIYIPHLNRMPNYSQTVLVAERLPSLETLTPVQGEIRVTHQGTYLEVAAVAETIITLTCDRCLQQYNHRLQLDSSELIWLREATEFDDIIPLDRDLEADDLVESLPPNGHFHPDTWLYEQLSLELPIRNLCDDQCPGIPVDAGTTSPLTDHRWAALAALKDAVANPSDVN